MDRIKELEAALKEFGRHKEWCHWLYFVTEPCDCGLHYIQGINEEDEYEINQT